MRLPSQGAAVQMDGDFGPSDFSIEISAHAFSVLSKGLYSDPFRAIVRELCCNAWDAHVEAGTTDRPFELYLPNSLAPVFKIRDYGVGLSEMGIRQVYTTYFKSTKQHSDAMTGCFGLGSKSPYAYTRKFTVISYYNGIKYHYNAIINEHGFPQILKMAEQPTDEPNGLEVSFSVDENDFYDFKRAAKIALRPFVVKPIVKGVAGFEPDSYPEDPVLEGDGWKLFQRLEGGNICTMGNVEYPIEATRSGFSSNAKKVLGLSIVVDFPLGSFEMTPSRESIQWTEFSVQNINDRLEQIYDEIVELASRKIEESHTFWEATVSAFKFLDGTGLKKLNIQPKWRGRIVKNTIDIPSDKGISVLKFTAVEPRGGRSSAPNSASINKTTRIDPVETTFYLADFGGAEYRLGNYVRDHFDRGQHTYLVSVVNKAALKAFCNTVGVPEKSLVLTSTVPKRARTGGGGVGGRRSRLAGSKARAFQFDMDGAGYSDCFWKEAEIDLDEPDLGVYVEITRWNPDGCTLASKPVQLRAALQNLKALGIDVPDGGLVGVRTAYKSKFENQENWMTLDAYVRAKLTEFWLSNSDFRYAYEFFSHVESRERNRIERTRKLAATLQEKSLIADDSYIVRFSKTFDRIYTWERKVPPFVRLQPALESPDHTDGALGLVLPHGSKAEKVVYSQRLLVRYPLFNVILRHIDHGYGYGYDDYGTNKNATYVAVAEYISMMDEKRRASPVATTGAPTDDVKEVEDEEDDDENE